MTKQCKARPNWGTEKEYQCPNPVFSNGYCQKHQYLRTDDKWMKKINDQKILNQMHKNLGIDKSSSFKETCDAFDKLTEMNLRPENLLIIPISDKHIPDDQKLDLRTLKQHGMIKPLPKKGSSVIRPYSKSKKDKKIVIAAIKLKLIKMFGKKCMLSGVDCEPDLFHIFPIGRFPEYETESWNHLLTTRTWNTLWANGTWEQIEKMQGLPILLKIIWDRDQDPNKKHNGSYYEQLMNRKDKV